MTTNNKYKIIIIGPSHPYRGGNSLFVSYLYDALQNLFAVKIYNYKLLYPSFLFPGKTQYDQSKVLIKKTENIRIVNSINPINWLSTAAKLNSEKADLIVFDWWHPFFGLCHFSISSLIKGQYRNRILFITENIVSHENNYIDRLLTKIGLKNADCFLVLSKKVEVELRAFARGRKIYRSELPVYDCYNMGETEIADRSSLQFSKNDKILLFFGYIRKYKGLDLLIAAMPRLIKRDPNFKLLIVGEFYENKSEYDGQISSLNIDRFVKIVDRYVANEEVHKYYSIADLVVLPYRSATQSGILNMAYGFNKPVLVTDVGGLSEFVDDKETGIVINNADASSIVEGVNEFFNLRSSVDFKHNIEKRRKHNSFEAISSVFDNILRDIQE